MTQITEVATGLRFPEGPIAMPDGSIVLVEIERQTLSRVSPNGKMSVLAELGGGPHGAAYITLSETGRLVSMRWPRPGLALNDLPQ